MRLEWKILFLVWACLLILSSLPDYRKISNRWRWLTFAVLGVSFLGLLSSFAGASWAVLLLTLYLILVGVYGLVVPKGEDSLGVLTTSTKINRQLSEQLAVAAHQLRTPLTSIRGYLSLLLAGDFGKIDSTQTDILEKIFRSSNRLSRMVDVFLDVSLIERGFLNLNLRPVNLVSLLQEVVDNSQLEVEEKGLALIFQPDLHLLDKTSFLDSDKIYDVVSNLVDNAIKYTTEGQIELKLSLVADQWVLFVNDTGLGLSKNDTMNLFKKFKRGSAVKHTSGQGLGLFVAYNFVSVSGGQLELAKNKTGVGTSVKLVLPYNKNPSKNKV